MKCPLCIGKIFETATLVLARATWHDAVRRKMIQLGERLRQYRCPLQLRFFASGSMLGKKELKLLRPVDGSGGKHE
jgi:hypothetical protein